jgi:ABC-2 type transport system ATP-binding protein
MTEVEEICDNVTIMRKGDVVFHGGIDQLREQAPQQGHRLATDDDARALEIARAHPQLTAQRVEDGGLSVSASQDRVDGLVVALVDAGVAIRSLEYTETPLESLFFMLTEEPAEAVEA